MPVDDGVADRSPAVAWPVEIELGGQSTRRVPDHRSTWRAPTARARNDDDDDCAAVEAVVAECLTQPGQPVHTLEEDQRRQARGGDLG